MPDEPGRLKERVACCFVGFWKQYQWGLLRLAEARALVISLRATDFELRDGGLMGVIVGRGKKRRVAVDVVVQSVEEELSQAELLRFNLQF